MEVKARTGEAEGGLRQRWLHEGERAECTVADRVPTNLHAPRKKTLPDSDRLECGRRLTLPGSAHLEWLVHSPVSRMR